MVYSATTFHLLALLCTLLVEDVGMSIWARIAYPRPWRAVGCALAVNLIVHTLFWYTQPIFVADWPIGLYRAELLVVLLEGAIYARFLALSGITPWLLSAGLNLASFLRAFGSGKSFCSAIQQLHVAQDQLQYISISIPTA